MPLQLGFFTLLTTVLFPHPKDVIQCPIQTKNRKLLIGGWCAQSLLISIFNLNSILLLKMISACLRSWASISFSPESPFFIPEMEPSVPVQSNSIQLVLGRYLNVLRFFTISESFSISVLIFKSILLLKMISACLRGWASLSF